MYCFGFRVQENVGGLGFIGFRDFGRRFGLELQSCFYLVVSLQSRKSNPANPKNLSQ